MTYQIKKLDFNGHYVIQILTNIKSIKLLFTGDFIFYHNDGHTTEFDKNEIIEFFVLEK